MMPRYHINPDTKESSACRAQQGRCPYGEVSRHFDSQREAQAYSEAIIREEYTQTPVASILDPQLLLRDIEEGFVSCSKHPDDPSLMVLCYTTRTQLAGHWNGVTKVARGLIVRSMKPNFSDARVVERPWAKFFTLSQMENGWHLGDEENTDAAMDEIANLDFSAPAEVTDKVDGSLGILYRAPDGQPALSTKGSFQSDQANMYTRILRNNPQMMADAQQFLDENGNRTFLFELVGPKNRIVLDYQKEDIILLGAVDKSDGHYLSPTDFSEQWSGGVTEVMKASSIGEAFELPDRPGREGVVIRIYSNDPEKQMQIKIKQEDYKFSARILSYLDSNKGVREALRNSDIKASDILAIAQDGNIDHIEGLKTFFNRYDTSNPVIASAKEAKRTLLEETIIPRSRQFQQAREFVDSLPSNFMDSDNPAKDFAMLVQKQKGMVKGDLFTLFQAKARGADLAHLSVRTFGLEIGRLLKADD